MNTLENTLVQVHDWVVDHIHCSCELNRYDDAYAIQCEFREWLDPTIDYHDVLSLEFIGD